MAKQIAIVLGHPDPKGNHFGHAPMQAYANGARAAGHEVRWIDVANMDFALLRSKAEHESGTAPPAIQQAQQTITWADHLVICYPLWLGAMPALVKGFLEQALRPGVAYRIGPGRMPKKLLTGKSARIVITRGMPAFAFRWYFGAHSLKTLKRSILGFCGIGPITQSLIGMVEGNGARRQYWLNTMETLGRRGR